MWWYYVQWSNVKQKARLVYRQLESCVFVPSGEAAEAVKQFHSLLDYSVRTETRSNENKLDEFVVIFGNENESVSRRTPSIKASGFSCCERRWIFKLFVSFLVPD